MLIILMDQRVFHSLLQKVGGNGRYQTILLIVWSTIMFLLGLTAFSLPFIFYQGEYQCSEGVTNCKEYVCSLPANQRAQFIHDDLYSMASKFGDYRCDNNVELDKLQSFIYLGGFVGLFVGGFTSQLITKRKLLIGTIVANIIGLVIILTGQTIFVASIGHFINSAANCIQREIVPCLIVQTVSEDVRGKHSMICYISESVGVTLYGLIFYLLKNWETYLIILLPILVIVLIFLVFYVQETPFDLIISSTPEESLEILKRIGQENNIQIQNKITLAEIDNIKREYQENEDKKEHDNISILDLFRYDSLRNLTLASLVLHFVVSFQFVAPEIAVRNYSLNMYLNVIIIGFAQLIGSIVCYYTVDDYARKNAIYITQAICLVTSCLVVIFFACNNGGCSLTVQILQTICLTIFRFGATVTYNFFYMQQYQAFPNQIRSLAIQFVCIPSLLSAIPVPQIVSFCERTGISIALVFLLCTIIIGIMTPCLPQTFGIPPPQMIEQLRYQHHDVKEQEKIKQT